MASKTTKRTSKQNPDGSPESKRSVGFIKPTGGNVHNPSAWSLQSGRKLTEDELNPADKPEAPTPGAVVAPGPGVYDIENHAPARRANPSKTAAEKEAETEVGDGVKTATDDNESTLTATRSSQDEGGESKGSKKNKRKVSRRKRIATAILVALFGGGALGFTTLTGPLKLLHFSNFLQGHFLSLEEFTNDRTSRIMTFGIRYAFTGTVQGTRLGLITGKYADRWESRMDRRSGVRPIYNELGRMVGFEITDPNKAKGIVDEFENDGFETRDAPGGVTAGRKGAPVTGRIIDLSDTRAKTRRVAIRSVVRGLDVNKVSSIIGSRTLIRLGGVDFHPIKNIKWRAGEKLVNYVKRKRAQREQAIRNGADPPNAKRLDGETRVDEQGNEVTNQDTDDAVKGGNAELDEAIDARNNGTLDDFKSKFAGKLLSRAGGGALAVIGAVCLVKSLGEEADKLQYANTVLPMMRMGFEFMSVAAQMKAHISHFPQDLTLDELRYYIDLLHDVEKDLPHVAAASIQYENGQPPTGPDISAGVKPDAVNGKPRIFQAIDAIPGIDTACTLTDVGGLIGRIPIIGDVYNATTFFVQEGINTALEATIGVTVDDFINSIVGWLAGEVVNLAATGAELGNIANYGARLAANTFAKALGGRELNLPETDALKEQERLRLAEEKRYMSFTERYFSMETRGSLTYAFAGSIAGSNVSSVGMSIIKSPFSMIGSILPKASAQPYTYDYGFKKVGFSVAEATNPIVEDPYANAEIVEAEFEDLNEKYGKCFPVKLSEGASETIVAVSAYSDEDIVNQFNDDDDLCNNPNDERLLRYRTYIADTMVAKSLSCYEGDSGNCAEIGFNGQGEPSTPRGGPIAVDDRAADTSAMACASEGLTGERVVSLGRLGTSIKLCTYGGIREVNAVWSVPVSLLHRANPTLTGDGWRDASEQIALRRAHCGTSDYAIYDMPASQCSPPTARPGRSNHEYGLAIDFNNCGSRGTACYQWLSVNARGVHPNIINLPGEPWHWSHDGN